MRRLLQRVQPDFALAAVCFLASFALYARTVAPGVLDDDGGEFQTNIFKLGVSHTGYPLFFLLAKLWTLLVPLGSIAYRANLFSALFGALTVALLYLTLRALARSRAAALFTAALWAVSRVEWSQSVIPRVYTLNSFFVVLLVLLAVLWRSRRIPLWCLVSAFGLSLANHRTIIFFGPALALWILVGAGRALWQPRRLLGLTLAFLLPLLLYLYIPLRGESDVGVEYHAANFQQMILAGNASLWLRFGPPGFLWSRLADFYAPLQVEQFTLFAVPFGLLGLIALGWNRTPRGFPAGLSPRLFLAFLAAADLFETAFAVVFWTVDSEKYFLPSYLLFLFVIGIGLALAFDWLAARALNPFHRSALAVGSGRRWGWGLALAGLLTAVCLYLGWSNFSKVDESANDAAETRWQEILSQPLERGALLVGNWESLTPLEYYQYVEGVRTDLQRDKVVIYRDQLALAPQGDVAQSIARRLAAGQAVYLTLHPSETETLGALSQRFDLIPIATLWRVENPGANSAPATILDTRFGDHLTLHSFALGAAAPRAGDFVGITFFWQPDQPLDANYKFSLRLRDAGGNLWIQQDDEPFGGLDPSRQWQPGQSLRDEEGFFIPPDAPPGEYSLELALYDADSNATLPADGAPFLTLGKVPVLAAGQTLPLDAYHISHSTGFSTSSGQMLGYGLSDEQPRAGDAIGFDTWWQNLGGQAETEIALTDARGTTSLLYHGALVQDASGSFNPRQIVRAHHTLTLPPTAAPGRALLTLSVDGRQFEIQPLELRPSDRQFTPPRPDRTQTAALGDSIRLLGYGVDRTTVQPGAQLHVTLYWHATRPPGASYKVFVHLLDPNGSLRAQQDSIPRGGALPTDRWLAGEYITDEYTLTVPDDATPGDYRIEIGMYSPDSGARVPALSADGARLADDRVLLDAVVKIVR